MDYSNFPDRERELFQYMRESCAEENTMTEIFPHVSEVLRDPRWPLEQGQKGFFKEFVCDLDTFEPYADKLTEREQLMIDSCVARIFLDVFRKTHGWELRIIEDDDWHAAALAQGLRRDYPEKAQEIKPMYRESLSAGTIRIVWGLYTTDLIRVRAFVQGLLNHPVVGRREIRDMGLCMVKYPSKDAMRLALKCAVYLALGKK